jgi:hypothetical protein
MVLVKVLGGLDLLAALVFLMLTFGFDVQMRFLLFFAGLLFVKGLFVFSGDVLSVVDLFSALMLILTVFFTLPAILLWIPAFLLIAKGFVSFI